MEDLPKMKWANGLPVLDLPSLRSLLNGCPIHNSTTGLKKNVSRPFALDPFALDP